MNQRGKIHQILKLEEPIESAMFDVFIFIFPNILPRYGIYICSTCTQLCHSLNSLNTTNGALQIHGAATLKGRSEADMMVMSQDSTTDVFSW